MPSALIGLLRTRRERKGTWEAPMFLSTSYALSRSLDEEAQLCGAPVGPHGTPLSGARAKHLVRLTQLAYSSTGADGLDGVVSG